MRPILQGLILTETDLTLTHGPLPGIMEQWQKAGGHLWLDVTNPDEALLDELKQAFRLDMQALQQILDPRHRAHVKEYEDYFFLQLPLPAHSEEDGEHGGARQRFASVELDLFASHRLILTIHQGPATTLQSLWERHAAQAGHRLRGRWPDTLLYEIIDAVLSAYHPHLEWLEDQHDRLEQLIFAGHRSQVQKVAVLKRDLHAVRRALAPLRDAIGQLVRRDFMLLDRQKRHLFDELFARSVRLLEWVANLHALFDGLFNADLSIQNTRMNEVMKALTVVATVMMPLTVLTGFFGMNFEYIPGLHSPVAFWVTTASMAATATGLFWFFKRRGWW